MYHYVYIHFNWLHWFYYCCVKAQFHLNVNISIWNYCFCDFGLWTMTYLILSNDTFTLTAAGKD